MVSLHFRVMGRSRQAGSCACWCGRGAGQPLFISWKIIAFRTATDQAGRSILASAHQLQTGAASVQATLSIMAATSRSITRQVTGRLSSGASRAPPIARLKNHSIEALAAPAANQIGQDCWAPTEPISITVSR